MQEMTNSKIQMTKKAQGAVVAEFISAWGDRAGTSPAPTDVATCHCEEPSSIVIARLAKPAEAMSLGQRDCHAPCGCSQRHDEETRQDEKGKIE